MYKVGMLCKHFKGFDLYDKNIYKILAIDVNSSDINFGDIIYSGDEENYFNLDNLVIYENIYTKQVFAREYKDLIRELSEERKNIFKQNYAVEPMDDEEIEFISTEEFFERKKEIEKNKKR